MPGTNLIEYKFEGMKIEGVAMSNQKFYIDEINYATASVSRRLAEAGKEQMSEWLSKGHKYRIGTTGAASRNLQVVKTGGAGGVQTWGVAEGGATKNNERIRLGFKNKGEIVWTEKSPMGFSVKGGPPLQKIKMWAAQKGIRVAGSSIQKVKGYKSRRGKDVAPYARVKNKAFQADAIWAIRNAIAFGGSFRKESNWWDRYPSGRGYFDYPEQAAREITRPENPVSQSAFTSLAEYSGALVVDFLSGKKGAMTKWRIRGW